MNLFTAAFNKIFKNGNQQVLDKIKPLIVEINNNNLAFWPPDKFSTGKSTISFLNPAAPRRFRSSISVIPGCKFIICL